MAETIQYSFEVRLAARAAAKRFIMTNHRGS